MITIFTPVYNRADVLEKLYQSLLRQSDYDFEWLIIDDGSTDSVKKVVQHWIVSEEVRFPIRFYQQENAGKHRAVNRGTQLAQGNAFFIVDSDDYLTDDAVEMVEKWWKDVADDDNYAGVAGLKGDRNGDVIGRIPLFDLYVDATNLERAKYGLLGDKAEVYKTSVLRKNPFPEFEGENFLTEAVVWDRIAYNHLKIRWFIPVHCDVNCYLPPGVSVTLMLFCSSAFLLENSSSNSRLPRISLMLSCKYV